MDTRQPTDGGAQLGPVSTLKRLTKKKLYEDVVDQLRQLIRRGLLKAGERFPSEKELSAQLGVSIPVIREAFRVLESHGLVESNQGGGRYLREPRLHMPAHCADPLEKLERSVLLEVLEVREELELDVTALAVERADGEDMLLMESVLEAMNVMDLEQCLEQTDLDLDFHCALARSTKNRFYFGIVMYLMTVLKDMRQKIYLGESWRALTYEHWKIFHAIKNRDAEAAVESMRAHLRGIRSYLDRAPN